MSSTELAEIKNQVEYLIEMQFGRPCKSPWASPVLCACKKDGILRIRADYRALNSFAITNSCPLPVIDGLVDQGVNAKYFSRIDLRSGYHQGRMAEEYMTKTAFSIRHGHYEFKVVSFGFTNTSATS